MNFSTDDRLWDSWTQARRLEPLLTPEEFVARHALGRGDVMQRLVSLLAVREAARLPSLVDLADSRVFAGRRLIRVLGEGATGLVYEAEVGDGRRTALKILNPLVMADHGRRETLLREARVVMDLDHPGIISLLDAGEDRGYTWMETELIGGAPLHTLVDAAAPLEVRVAFATEVGIQLAAALHHAHTRGVVHRDLKPANVIRGEDGHFVLIDFGLASVPGSAFTLSRTGDAIGTPLYMSPEQLRGEARATPQTDLYSLGVLLLEVAQGRRLFAPRQALQALAGIASGRLRLGRREAAGLPRDFRRVLLRCLRSDPRERYPSADVLREDLIAVREGLTPRGARVPLGPRLRKAALSRRALAGLAVGVGAFALWSWANRPVRLWPWEAVPTEAAASELGWIQILRTDLLGSGGRPFRIRGCEVVPVGEKLMVIGGELASADKSSSILLLRPDDGVIEHGQLSEGRISFQAVSAGGEVLIPFGRTRTGAASTILRLDGRGISRSEVEPGLSRREGVAACFLGGGMFLAGGWSRENESGTTSITKSDVWFLGRGGELTELAPLEERRFGARAVAWKNRVFVVGGSGSASGPGPCSTVEVYERSSGTWSKLDSIELQEPCAYAGLGWSEGFLVLAGGQDEGGEWLDGVQVVDLSRSRSRLLEDRLTEGRLEPAVALLGSRTVVAYGGSAEGDSELIEVFDHVEGKKLAELTCPPARRDVAAAALGNAIYLVGGSSDGERQLLSMVERISFDQD